MYLSSRSQKAHGKPCIFCNISLQWGDDYGYSKTKSLTVNKITAPSKTLYFHTKCYNQLLPKNK